MSEFEALPKGLEIVYRNLSVSSAYRRPVEFDDILPGDLLIYRGSDLEYYFVHGRSRDHIHGWHFGGSEESGVGGWGQEYRGFVDSNVRLDRVAPNLTPTILKYYGVQIALKSLQKGHGQSL